VSDLDARLLAAHSGNDTPALVALYRQAAIDTPHAEARGFYLTHAHVFALELGHPDVGRIRAELIEMGRETPL
jgi:hypothetical protein